MFTHTSAPSVGILGLGFLGKILTGELNYSTDSWGTWHEIPPPEPLLPVLHFDWADENSWEELPKTAATLVLTIPPLQKNPETETDRLQHWATWMQQNRPQLKRLIYISTTGVYPKRSGIWTENSKFEADTLSGKLRLGGEKIRPQYFSLQVVRAGGIYGSGRGIDFRLKSGKPIPLSSTLVHRIHVQDLARIILHLVEHPESATCVNAVDLEAKPSWQVARWLIENRNDLTQEMFPESAEFSSSLPGTPQRVISNQRLRKLGITLRYPTFRQGME